MSTLRIYFSSLWRDSASICSWALCDASGAVLRSGSGALPSMPKAQECIGILAPDRTLSLSVKTPPVARRQWKTALPFLAENQTLPDPEENHVVLSFEPDGGQMPLMVTDKAWLRQIVTACSTAGLPLRKVIPEALLPALAQGCWTLVWNGTGGFVRSGPSTGMMLDEGDAETAPIALQLMLNNSSIAQPQKIEICLMQNPSTAEIEMPHWRNIAIPLTQGRTWDWRRDKIPLDAPNLLAGELAPPSRLLEWWPKLRPAALILLAVLTIELLGSNVQWAMLAYEKKSLVSAMELSFRKAFGNEIMLVNAPLQMQRNLADMKHGAGLADDGDFLMLTNLVAKSLARLPEGSVRALHYEGGRLEIEINTATAGEVSTLQESLRNSGLYVRVDTHSAGSGLNTKLTIQLAAAI